MSAMHELHGNCHCGLFKFTAKTTPIDSAWSCNCSYCSRVGYVVREQPFEDRDILIEKGGEESLKVYTFEKANFRHMFCPVCGTSVMMKMKDGKMRINLRTLRDLDLDAVEVKVFDGATKSESTTPQQVDALEDGKKVYNGNCHCGAVKFSVKTKPFTDPEQKVMNCNCSLCSRNGDLWIYPSKKDVQLDGGDSLTDYVFLHEDSLHSFCSECGVSVLVRVTDPKEDVCPVNVRTINGVDLEGLTLRKYDGKKNDPQYVV